MGCDENMETLKSKLVSKVDSTVKSQSSRSRVFRKKLAFVQRSL